MLTAAEKKQVADLESEIGLKTLAAVNEKDPAKQQELLAEVAKLTREKDDIIDPAEKIRAVRIVPATESVLPDEEARFVLHYQPSSWSDDTVEIKTLSNGLLDEITSIAADKTAETVTLIVKGAADAAVFSEAGGFSDLTKKPTLGMQFTPEEKADCKNQPDFSIEVSINPRDFAAAYETIKNEVIAKTGFHCLELEVRDQHAKLLYTSDTSASEPISTEALSTLKKRTQVRCAMCQKGACYRRKGSLQFKLRHETDDILSGSAQVAAYQLGEIGRVDFQRRAFVEAKTEVDFENGGLVRVKYTKPSQWLAGASIPIDILETLFGIPSKLFETESGRLKGQASVIEAQTGLVEAQANLIEKQRQLEATQDASQDTGQANAP